MLLALLFLCVVGTLVGSAGGVTFKVFRPRPASVQIPRVGEYMVNLTIGYPTQTVPAFIDTEQFVPPLF